MTRPADAGLAAVIRAAAEANAARYPWPMPDAVRARVAAALAVAADTRRAS